ncbi:MAG: peptidase MA family metallohydrolase [Chloroflexota bacterium]
MYIRRLIITAILLSVPFLIPLSMEAQSPTVEVTEETIDSHFRDAITARLIAENEVEITEAEFFYRVSGQRSTSRNVAEFEPGKQIEAFFSIDQERQETYMPPGTELEYWWKLTDANGESFKTEVGNYTYLDNRFDFKHLSSDRLTLYWYNGGRSFGDALFRQATKALDLLETDVGVTLERPIKIFIYGTHDDLLSALSVSSQEWTGGVAYSDYGVVVIGVRTDNLDWGLKAMTHELTHLVVHQATDNPYGDIPRWLDEGLAVYNESPEGLDEQFSERFMDAVNSNSLMTLQTLSSTFPADSEAANLAYGQSGAVVHFILDNYGTEALSKLLEIFSEGALYDNALEEAFGEDTKSLDNAFRDHWGLAPLDGPLETQAETGTSDTDADAADSPEAQPAPEANDPEPEAEAPKTEEPADSAPEAATQTDRGGLLSACLGGLLPLAALGLVATRRRQRWFV